jgi:hypothetical protein
MVSLTTLPPIELARPVKFARRFASSSNVSMFWVRSISIKPTPCASLALASGAGLSMGGGTVLARSELALGEGGVSALPEADLDWPLAMFVILFLLYERV